MKILTIGPGRWGTFIASYLCSIGNEVSLYGREGSENFSTLLNTRQNNYQTIDKNLLLTDDISAARDAEVIVISINSQGLRGLIQSLEPLGLKNKMFVLCMKGIEIETGKRLSEIVSENVDESCSVAVWLGPGHVEDFCKGLPNCMVIDSDDQKTKSILVESFSSDLIRFYYGTDLIGNEVGAAAKNVIGIAAGMLDGFSLTALKGALMSRGAREVARLIKLMGGNELSAYGLCHLGDYEATVFSKHSHNRMFGEAFIKNESYSSLAEGFYTVKALKNLEKQYGAELPITDAVYRIIHKKQDGQTVFNSLFSRSLKEEF